MGFSIRPRIENFQKTAKKFKILENTIIASFPAKIGWERSRKREKKKKKSFRFAPTQPGIGNFKQIAEKIQKIREHHHSFFSGQNTMGKVEKE